MIDVSGNISRPYKKVLEEWGLSSLGIIFRYSDPKIESNITEISKLEHIHNKLNYSDYNFIKKGDLKFEFGINTKDDSLLLDYLYAMDISNLPKARPFINTAIVTLNRQDQIVRLLIMSNKSFILNPIPEELENLNSLTIYSNYSGKNETLPEVIFPKNTEMFTNLELLYLVNVSIDSLNPALFFSGSLKSIFLNNLGNLSSPPKEIYEQGLHSIRNYLEQIQESKEFDYLYEAKMVLVGRGFAGKTTIANKLTNPNYNIDTPTDSTEGIVINEWDFPIPLERSDSFKLNIWDFGGQEKYDATHQFFLTERTVYLFITEARLESNYLDFDYWLNIVDILSNGSPVIVVQNKIDERKKKLPTERYRSLFKNIQSFVDISCADGYQGTIESLIKEIKIAVRKLPQIGDELPKAWVDIRKDLEVLNEDYISLNEYYSLCKSYGLETERADFLSRYFHDLGIIVHFINDPLLKGIVVINPDWAVDGIYSVLDTRKVENQLGRFDMADLNQIWTGQRYQNKRIELLALMKNFGLCFELSKKGHFIAPELLSPNPPKGFEPFKEEGTIMFIYKYDFMPAGMLTRLIVKTHRLIENNTFWKHGLLLKFEEARAIIIEDDSQKLISIQVTGGQNKKDLLSIVRKELLDIYYDLNRKIIFEELVPCNCDLCLNDLKNSHYFKWRTLMTFLEKGKKSIPCEKSTIDMKVSSMVGKISNAKSTQEAILTEQLDNPKPDANKSISSVIAQKRNSLDWFKKSILGGISSGIIVLLLLVIPKEYEFIRIALVSSTIVTVILFIRDPKTRYMRAFWFVMSTWSMLNLFPEFQFKFWNINTENTSGSQNLLNLITTSPESIVGLGLILVMIILLMLDFLERKNT